MINNNVRHIKNFQIKNFKCFDYFELKELGQINLILGDNNSGKTSTLEALLFDPILANYLENLRAVLSFRNLVWNQNIVMHCNYVNFFINQFSNDKKISVKAEYIDQSTDIIELEILSLENLNDSEKSIVRDNIISKNLPRYIARANINNTLNYRSLILEESIERSNLHIPFVSANTFYAEDLLLFYSTIQNDRDLKKELVENLQTFYSDIEDIDITTSFIDNQPLIGIWLKDKKSMLPLTMFGDGTIKLFRFLVEIQTRANKYICIDEIDLGIHYSRFESFWHTILKAAEKYNTQLFITTHDEECLRALKNTLNRTDLTQLKSKTKSFTLENIPDGSIKAFSYNFDEFEYALNKGRELRGDNNA